MCHLRKAPTIRIPVSLVFESESAFFQDFVMDLRENRTLSTLIVDLLKAYYEHNDIKSILDVAIISDSPMTEIQAQLERVKLEHQKNIFATSMLQQHTEASLSDVEFRVTQEDSTSSSPTSSSESGLLTGQVSSAPPITSPVSASPDTAVLSRLSALESTIPSIDRKLDDLMALMAKQMLTTPSSELPVQPLATVAPEDTSPHPISEPLVVTPAVTSILPDDSAIISAPSVSTEHHGISAEASEVKTRPVIDTSGLLPQPQVSVDTLSPPSTPNLETVPVTVPADDGVEKAPPSLGKVLKSIGKK